MGEAVSHYHGALGVAGYDACYPGPSNGDVAFYVGTARAAGGPVLEFGAGSSRITQPLAEAGLDVTAVDL